MAEKRTEVKTYVVRYICDDCGEGEMVPTGQCLTSWPAKYPHKCSKCGASATFTGSSYPRTVYKEVPNAALRDAFGAPLESTVMPRKD